jgi:S-adenosylmethionine hydrolase
LKTKDFETAKNIFLQTNDYSMPIVTLTTDFGWQDHYLAAIKGALLCENAQLNLVDLTHGVDNYDIVQAAFLFKNTWKNFPEGTIHLISVNDYGSEKQRLLAAVYQGHYFVAPDNGLFSLVFEEEGPKVYHALDYDKEIQFPIRKAYASAIGHLANERDLEALGPVADDIERRITLQPVTNKDQIRGSIIYIDHYENAITNINKDLFEKIGKGRLFKLYFKRHDPIVQLSRHYSDVPIGEPLCLFNAAAYLEIAINMGRAASLLGLKKEDSVQIDFYD